MLLNLSFSLLEWLAIMGLAQSILIITYIIVRIYSWQQAALPLIYFSSFAILFFAQFSLRLEDVQEIIRLILWGAWAAIPPLSYLLILQITYNLSPKLKEYWVILLPIFTFIFIFKINNTGFICNSSTDFYCDQFFSWLYLSSGIISTICLLFLFGHKDLFTSIKKKNKGGFERYWLIISLIIMNMGVALTNILRTNEAIVSNNIADAILLVMGLGFIYLTTTMFFRIYPPAISIKNLSKKQAVRNIKNLNHKEYEIALKIKELMEVDKLYQEPNFSRADLAKELNISENIISQITNTAFGKSFPQMLNERRVEDAKIMLEDPNIPIKIIAFEAGFNSLASFNRVFKNLTGESPSNYRIEKLVKLKEK